MVPKLTGQCWGSPLADVPGKPCTPWVPLEAICYYITVTSYVIVFFLERILKPSLVSHLFLKH